MQKRQWKCWIRKLTVLTCIVFIGAAAAPAAARKAVVATVAADYSSAAHSVISVDPVGGPRSVRNELLPTGVSDIALSAHGPYFYRIERFQADNVTKFHMDAPETPIWQFSTNDADEEGSSNPHSLVFIDESKAYLLRYGKPTAWIVNPSASGQADFKIGELDLSAYADADGIPEMTGGVVSGSRLFIVLQRLDREQGFVPSNTAYVAVFDTTTDAEIDTATENDDDLPGIALPVRNPMGIQVSGGDVWVYGPGDYGADWAGRDPAYTGGIARIDTLTYETELVVDDGDADDHPYGHISGMTLVSVDKGYFVGYAGWGDNTLYAFNPLTGDVAGPANADLTGKNIAGMNAGAFADANGMLWVCNATDAEVAILDPADDRIDETIDTVLNPVQVVFVSKPAAPPVDDDDVIDDDDDSGGGGGGDCFIGASRFSGVGTGLWAALAACFGLLACLSKGKRN